MRHVESRSAQHFADQLAQVSKSLEGTRTEKSASGVAVAANILHQTQGWNFSIFACCALTSAHHETSVASLVNDLPFFGALKPEIGGVEKRTCSSSRADSLSDFVGFGVVAMVELWSEQVKSASFAQIVSSIIFLRMSIP